MVVKLVIKSQNVLARTYLLVDPTSIRFLLSHACRDEHGPVIKLGSIFNVRVCVVSFYITDCREFEGGTNK